MGIVIIASLSVGADVVLDAGAGVGVITNLITVRQTSPIKYHKYCTIQVGISYAPVPIL